MAVYERYPALIPRIDQRLYALQSKGEQAMQNRTQNTGVRRRAVAVILDLIVIGSITQPIWATSAIFSISTRATGTGQIVPDAIQFYANPWGGLFVVVIPIVYFTLMEGLFGATAG